MRPDPLQQLREVHAVQGRDGCWDIDDYMLGLYNGLELALSLMEQRDVHYKTRKEPKREWVELTDEERDWFVYKDEKEKRRFREYGEYIEQRLKEKNHAT